VQRFVVNGRHNRESGRFKAVCGGRSLLPAENRSQPAVLRLTGIPRFSPDSVSSWVSWRVSAAPPASRCLKEARIESCPALWQRSGQFESSGCVPHARSRPCKFGATHSGRRTTPVRNLSSTGTLGFDFLVLSEGLAPSTVWKQTAFWSTAFLWTADIWR